MQNDAEIILRKRKTLQTPGVLEASESVGKLLDQLENNRADGVRTAMTGSGMVLVTISLLSVGLLTGIAQFSDGLLYAHAMVGMVGLILIALAPSSNEDGSKLVLLRNILNSIKQHRLTSGEVHLKADLRHTASSGFETARDREGWGIGGYGVCTTVRKFHQTWLNLEFATQDHERYVVKAENTEELTEVKHGQRLQSKSSRYSEEILIKLEVPNDDSGRLLSLTRLVRHTSHQDLIDATSDDRALSLTFQRPFSTDGRSKVRSWLDWIWELDRRDLAEKNAS